MYDSLKNSPLDPVEMMASANRCVDLWAQNPDSCLHVVAVNSNEVIGVVLVKEHWNLVSLFVKSQYQHAGIGKKLALAAIDGCRGKNRYNAIYLNSAQDSVEFYAKLGFVRRQLDAEGTPGIVPMLFRYQQERT